MSSDAIAEAKSIAQSLVTAILHDDRDLAAELAGEFCEREDLGGGIVLALVLGDLASYVHKRWADSVGLCPAHTQEAWQDILTEIAARG